MHVFVDRQTRRPTDIPPVLGACLGYWLSWTWSLPTGPVMVALAAVFWGLGGIKRLVEGRP